MDKPPLHQTIEARFGRPLRSVLERIKGLDSLVPDILGVDQRTSDLLYRRLGVSLETALALRSSRSDTYRGTWQVYDRFAVDYYEEHGYPTSPRAEDVRNKMDALVDNLWRHRQ